MNCTIIENTRWVSFDIKFTRQAFENACWHHEACRAIQHAFSKPSLVNLISKDANLVFYLSVYLFFSLQTSDNDVFFNYFCVDSASLATSLKSSTSSWPDKGTCREIDNVYQAKCSNTINMRVTNKHYYYYYFYYYYYYNYYYYYYYYSLSKLTLDWLIFAKIFVIFVRLCGVLRPWSRFYREYEDSVNSLMKMVW